jgi:hypothetical protein
MSTWHEERRRNQAADADQRRKDKDADLDRRLKAQAAEDKRRREEQAAREADERRRKRERKAAWKARADWVANNTDLAASLAVMVAGMIPAFYFQYESLTDAKVFGGLAALLAFMLEAGAWAATVGEIKAMKAGRTVLPYRVAIWCFTTAAASINFSHGAEKALWLGAVLAASSIVPVALFHMVMAGRHAAKPKPDPEAKARARHEKKRRKDHKDVVKLAEKLVSAAPYGALDFEDAFASAWEVKYGTRTPGMTPALHAQAHASRKALNDAFDAANGSPVSMRGRLLELLHPAPVSGSLSEGSSQRVTQIPPSSEAAPKRSANGPQKPAQKGARKKPVPPRRTPGDSVPFHPVVGTLAADTARKVAAVNGHHH